ncbi:DUF1570 domain-containing protein [Rubinisphaera margarita]|uniref:DUF1570 domain-containing protein n=1 Tax=Rubinisphaera margarita TaxID=2909586 RepID=UPI001EE8804F|nr:DUF1570 domain-containing protein [Rubinisphaera margarita]MCG6155815.1 DUF1570 domain-containing protein [Rubinisphaera margarita]
MRKFSIRRPYLLRKACSVLLIAGLLAFCCAETRAQGWPVEFTHEHFVVHSQVPGEKILPAVRDLSALQKRIGDALQITVYDERIDIIIFSSHSQYRAYIRPRVPEAASRPALFVKGPDRLYVYVVYSDRWERDLRHEMTHATLHASLPYLPIWVDEGLAKYFEVPDRDEGLNRDLLGNLKWRLRFRQDVRTRELEQIQSLTDMKPEHYRDSWAWIYFLLHYSEESRTLLQAYLQEIQEEEVVGSLIDRIFAGSADAHADIDRFYR